MRNALEKGDEHLDRANLQAVVSDTNLPENIDSTTTPGNDQDPGQDLDV